MALLLSILFFFSWEVQANWKQKIIQDAQELYQPIAYGHFRKPIEFKILDSPVIAGSADHQATHLAVVLNTGLLNSPRLSPDALRMIVCHELGHLFGGRPRKSIPMEWDGPIDEDGFSFMSAEGQADYYASFVCFRELVKTQEGEDIVSVDWNRVGPLLFQKCSADNLCLRAAIGGLDFLNLVQDFPISCESHDPKVTTMLIRDSYPERQCRLDTLIEGARFGQRPKCWFP